MALLTLQRISKAFGGPPILQDASVTIVEGDRACITGRNGEGKSTLLKIMAGLLEPDDGEMARAPGLRAVYLSQDVPEDRPGTAEEVCEAAAHGLNGHSRAQEFLTRLGVPRDTAFTVLSGGQRRRTLLAAALAGEPDLLLLDEPTNHLDIETIEWLEGYLARAPLACVFVTHDRAFLRRTARRVFDMTPCAYILLCADGTLYTGWTNDIEKRLAAHNAGRGAKYTRGRRPVTLLYSEECATKSEAMSREAAIKKLSREEKLMLSEGKIS